MSLSVSAQNALGHAMGSQAVANELAALLNGTIPSAVITTETVGVSNVTTLNPTNIVRAGREIQCAAHAKVGTSAGWVVGAGNNLGTVATMAAGQTGGTLVIRIDGLNVGDTITGFSVFSSINSGGNAVTLDANLRKLTIAAGANATDASVGSITQVSVTAATASAASKTGLNEVVVSGVTYYLLLTATTAASTTIELLAPSVTITTS